MSQPRSLTEIFGAFVAATRFDAIPAEIVVRAKVSLVHNLALAIAGRPRERIAHAMAKRLWSAPAEATLLHDGVRVSPEAAAFANAALIHTRSQDDTHPGSSSHPGGVVMPAALAIAEREGRSGAEFLAGLVLGYEVLCRVGRDFDEAITGRGFRVAPVIGGFGAAAAAASLLGLGADQTTHAIGLAAHLAGGLGQVWVEGSAEWPLQLGCAARNGVMAARTAQAGATAARHILEGKGGFYRAYANTTEPAVEAIAGLGETWQFAEVTVKAHPVCAILQGPLDSLLRLVERHKVDPSAVAEASLTLSPYEAAYPGIDNTGPIASATAAKMSAQFSLALGLLDGRVTMDGLHRFADPAIAALSARVSVAAESAIAPRESRLTLRLTDGSTLTDAITAAVGRPSFAEITTFARGLAAESGAPSNALDRMIGEIDQLDRARSLGGLLTSITAVGRP